MKTFRIFIGSNNVTGTVELDIIESKLNQQFNGYTIEECAGYWLGKRENSVIITLSAEESKVLEAIADLKQALKQDAIGYQVTTKLNFI
jgi:hypothetical protein